jgi:hypothetical protein
MLQPLENRVAAQVEAVRAVLAALTSSVGHKNVAV